MKNDIIIETMDPILVSIYGIKDIEEISFTNLIPSVQGGKMSILPSLYIRYNGGNFLNLCSKDKYFDIYVKKVFETYMLEKDNVVVDPTFNPFGTSTGIKIDEKTKTMLESGDLVKISEMYSFYEGKKGYNNSLVFQSDEFKLLLPLIKYHLKQLFDLTSSSITIDDVFTSGYRNNYSMNYKFDGIDDILLINFVSHNINETFLRIRSRDKRFKPLEMKIEFNEKGIKVKEYFVDYNLYCENSYDVGENNIINTIVVNKDTRTIIYKKNNLEIVNNPFQNISSIDSEDNLTWFSLPWNAYYGVNDREEKLSEVDGIMMSNNKYLAIIDNEFMLREYASKEYRRKKTQDANQNNIVMDEVHKRVYGILLNSVDGIYLIETYFLPTYGCSGYYSTYLNDRYFYHLAQNKEKIKDLRREDLISISKDDNIIVKADLLVDSDIKKVLKR